MDMCRYILVPGYISVLKKMKKELKLETKEKAKDIKEVSQV